ncbi:MAG: DUF4159 domain-containing protein [Planctomycetales bacterium]|nr:DUF4159 domain-containing protein [Planctomycetales bacterium]
MRNAFVICLALGAALSAGPQVGRADDITAEEVRAAIERGAAYLKSKQNKVDGSWAEHPGQPGGMTALCTLALLNAGVKPDDEAIQKALNFLRLIEKPKMTYSTALATMAFVAADPSPANKDKALIRRNADYLASIQITAVEDGPDSKKGTWAYSDNQGNGDNSNTQFALLALHEAERIGVKVRDDVWRLSLNYWLRTQNDSGGWGYFEGQPTTGSMTCAGIASVVMCSGQLSAGDARIEGQAVRCCLGADETDKAQVALQNAAAWMGRNFSVNSNPSGFGSVEAQGKMWLLYYLYGVERAGRMTGRRFFVNARGDKYDWYRMGAELLARRGQDKLSGSWTGVGHSENNPLVGTSLALLFLSKGRRPVVISNLQREPDDDWNHHRGAIGALVRGVERRWGRDLTWQIIESRAAGAEDLLQSPVLFISGRDQLRLSAKEKENLRAYVNAGGFIFAEAACAGGGFDRDFRSLMEELFPDSPLRPLPPDHPIWFADAKTPVNPEETPLWGLNSCCRTSVAYCPKNLSCYWELAGLRDSESQPAAVRERVERAMALGANVLAYATGRELRDKLDVPQLVGAGEAAPQVRGSLYVAKLRHSGGSDDAPSALANLLTAAHQEAGLPVSSERRLIPLGDAVFDYPIVFMHGRRSFRFSDSERAFLRQHIERGGFLMADAICASEDFARSFRREIAATFRDARLAPIADSHPLFTQEYRGYDVTRVTLRDPAFRAPGDPLKAKLIRVAPTLEGLEIDGRLAIVFSPYDMSCALENSPSLECKGYDRRDAARLGVNILLYALQN